MSRRIFGSSRPTTRRRLRWWPDGWGSARGRIRDQAQQLLAILEVEVEELLHFAFNILNLLETTSKEFTLYIYGRGETGNMKQNRSTQFSSLLPWPRRMEIPESKHLIPDFPGYLEFYSTNLSLNFDDAGGQTDLRVINVSGLRALSPENLVQSANVKHRHREGNNPIRKLIRHRHSDYGERTLIAKS